MSTSIMGSYNVGTLIERQPLCIHTTKFSDYYREYGNRWFSIFTFSSCTRGRAETAFPAASAPCGTLSMASFYASHFYQL